MTWWYIAPFVEEGDDGVLSPLGAAGDWSCYELGPYALVRAKSRLPAGPTLLGENLDERLTARLVNDLHTMTGHPVPRTTLRLALAELAVTPDRGWTPIRKPRKGVQRLVLDGETVWANVAGGASVHESWGVPDAADSVDGIYDWTLVQLPAPAQTGVIDIEDGAIQPGVCCVAINVKCEVPLRTDAQEVTATIEWLGTGGRGGPLTRFANDGKVTNYRGQVENTQLQSARIFRFVNGAGIILANVNYASMPTGTGVQFDVTIKSTHDDLHSLRFDDTELIGPTSNSVITGNVHTGVMLTADDPGVVPIHILDWAAADIKPHGSSLLQVLGAI